MSFEILLNEHCFPVASILQSCIVVNDGGCVFWSQVQAIQSILYTSEEDAQQQPPALSPIMEASEERPKQEMAHKRKSISDLDEFGVSSSSRQRLSDILDVQLCGSPLTSFS